MLSSDLKRAFLSKNFLIAVLGVSILFLLPALGDLRHSTQDVAYFFNMSSQIGRLANVLVIFCTLPFAWSFCNEWNTKYIRFSVIRRDVTAYSWSKIAACGISSGLSVVLGIVVFLFLSFLWGNPLVSTQSLNFETFSDSYFGVFLKSGEYLLYFFSFLWLYFLSGMFWGILGLCISGFLPNVFVVITAPFVLQYTISNVFTQYHFPRYVDLYYLGNGRFDLSKSPYVNLFYGTLVFVGLSLGAGYIFSKSVRRRLANG